MKFTDEEVKVIHSIIGICIKSIEFKKGHKSKNEILVLNKMKEINERINNYMEE